jgi:hypothetical protein
MDVGFGRNVPFVPGSILDVSEQNSSMRQTPITEQLMEHVRWHDGPWLHVLNRNYWNVVYYL